jgi:hypothetical protein
MEEGTVKDRKITQRREDAKKKQGDGSRGDAEIAEKDGDSGGRALVWPRLAAWRLCVRKGIRGALWTLGGQRRLQAGARG